MATLTTTRIFSRIPITTQIMKPILTLTATALRQSAPCLPHGRLAGPLSYQAERPHTRPHRPRAAPIGTYQVSMNLGIEVPSTGGVVPSIHPIAGTLSHASTPT